VLEKEETEELKRFDEPGLILMGFKPTVMLKKQHYLRPSLFVYPEESLVSGECRDSLLRSLGKGQSVDTLFWGTSLVNGCSRDSQRLSLGLLGCVS
jgi:hypothetical protein